MKRLFATIIVVGLVCFFIWHEIARHSETVTETSSDKHSEEPAKEDSPPIVQLTEAGQQAISIVTEPLTGTTLPASALVWFNGKSYIYLETEPLHFRRQEIIIHSFHKDTYEVDRLPDQATVVIQGAQMLLSEEQRSSVEGAAE